MHCYNKFKIPELERLIQAEKDVVLTVKLSSQNELSDTWVLQASENLGMAMVYTLVTSAKEWLSERYSQDAGTDSTREEEVEKDEVGLFVLSFSLQYVVYAFDKFKYIDNF